ncbi:MAG: T9SS type A sorting domain-containing protein, partial [Chitinophagales bacterium]|nr:T9SS type A sorting domain-containing protein [Chitinophagales bacterium]
STPNPQLSVQPNPFSNSTNIIFSISQEEQVSIVIYDLLGKEVKTFSGNYKAGEHQLQWNGESKNKILLAKGMYHVKLEARNKAVVVKAVLLK